MKEENPKDTTIASIQTEAEESKNKNFLEEYELINDSFPDEDPK